MANSFECGNGPFKNKLNTKKTLLLIAVVLIITVLTIFLCFNQSKALAQQKGSGSIVIEAKTGKILYSYNKDMRLEMASTTKIATAIVAIENGDLSQKVKITKEMAGVEGSSIYLKEGEVWTLRDLLYGLMLQSGNDAATAIAIAVGGSVQNFVNMMNEYAQNLGLKNTHFENPHGLHSQKHYTSAYDLATITAKAFENEDFKKIVSTKAYEVEGSEKCKQRTIYNKNKLLSQFDGANGVKTGYTTDSGRCFVGAANRGGMQLISVVLNCYDMWEKTKKMLNSAFNEYSYVKIGDKSKALDMFNLNDCSVELRLADDIYYPIKNGEKESFVYKFRPLQSYPDSLQAGDEIGYIDIYSDNHLIFSQKIITINEIKYKGVLLSLMNYVGDWQINALDGEIEQIFGVVRSVVEERG